MAGDKERTGLSVTHTFPEGEYIVAMINFNDQIMVATNRDIYEIYSDWVDPIGGPITRIRRMKFEWEWGGEAK